MILSEAGTIRLTLIGGTGTSHIGIAIARSCIRAGRKARYFNVVDLVNKLEATPPPSPPRPSPRPQPSRR